MEPFSFNKYYAKKKFLKIFGGEIKIFTEDKSQLLFFVKQKAFKLKEDITVYSDESMRQVLLKIQARSIIDFSAAYDITDGQSGTKLGAVRRKGFSSILRDRWVILNNSDNPIGEVVEDSGMMAFLRRFLSNLIPQSFNILVGNSSVGLLKQTFNPFVPQFMVDFSSDSSKKLDRKMGIAIVVLLQIIEGRQN
jgi:hypothetical protein